MLADGWRWVTFRNPGRRRRAVALALGLALLLAATACALDDRIQVTNATLIGTWHDDLQGTMAFREDMSFTATEVKDVILHSSRRKGVTFSGAGTWRLVRPIGAHSGPTSEVQLDFDGRSGPATSYTTQMVSDKDGDALVLFFYLGDPDTNTRYTFRRASG